MEYSGLFSRNLPFPQTILHSDADIGRELSGAEVVAVARLEAEAPAFFVFDRSFGGGMDCLIDRSRVDLQAVH